MSRLCRSLTAPSLTFAFLVAATLPVPAVAGETSSLAPLARVLSWDGTPEDFGDSFGRSADIDQATLVVGAQTDDVGTHQQGAAYVYERVGSLWLPGAQLVSSDPSGFGWFGFATAIDANTVVVGQQQGGPFDSGFADIFERDFPAPGAWGRRATVGESDAFDEFGAAVAVDGDTVVVGAIGFGWPSNETGAVYVYERDLDGPNAWGRAALLMADDGVDGDRFGASVAIDGDTIVVGAWTAGLDGAAYIFEREEAAWVQVSKLEPDPLADVNWFGNSVAIHGDTLAVGANWAPGSAHLYERDVSDPDVWNYAADLRGSDDVDSFGDSVAVHGDRVVVGASGGLGARGAAFVFARQPDNLWAESAKLAAPTETNGSDNFGNAVAVSAEYVVVSASAFSNDFGSAYLFEEPTALRIEASGVCPREVAIAIASATPDATITIWSGSNSGTSSVPSGPCAGTPLDLEEPELAVTGTTDPEGSKFTVWRQTEQLCDLHLQVLDETTCETSAVVLTPRAQSGARHSDSTR